uniref:ribosomal protein S4 n=1 Tax=Euglena agilis TaxID=96764 RepID=UPI0023AABF6D|nr:ribosomal protein S4 [Euglena agilis]WCH63283.1 ribosomal protein S4 [Euglena agilis]
MSKYRGPRLRIIRRFGKLPGLTNKTSKKNKAPGLNGSVIKIRKKTSKYSIRLKEKQRLRYHYGITEQQLLNYMKKARKRKGSSGRTLLNLLEMRLDTLVYRLKFAPTIVAAKQLINHGHIYVNEKTINLPGFICKLFDVIKVKMSLVSEKLVRKYMMNEKMLVVPPHIRPVISDLRGQIIGSVHAKSLSLLINELLIVEYYSRKL